MACPARDTLVAYTLGEPFQTQSAADIAAHVDACRQCTTFVGGVVDMMMEWTRTEPTATELAAIDGDMEAGWRDFVARNGEELGFEGQPEGGEDPSE